MEYLVLGILIFAVVPVCAVLERINRPVRAEYAAARKEAARILEPKPRLSRAEWIADVTDRLAASSAQRPDVCFRRWAEAMAEDYFDADPGISPQEAVHQQFTRP